jgi:hypothetical protein
MLLSCIAFSQKKAHHEDKSVFAKSRKSSRAKGSSKTKISCPVFASNTYPYQGFGFKLGDPFALTYKFYMTKHFSIAADLGKASSGLYNRYYHQKFSEYTMPDTVSEGASVNYLSSKAKSDWIGEVKILYSFDAKRISPGLQIYAGLGAQGKSTQLGYDYLYTRGITENEFGKFDRNRFTIGQTTIVGIEYAYFQLPISAFIELELFTDIMKDPGWQRFQGGIGIRYIF